MQWWADAGVDVMIDEEPHDWLRPQSAPPIEGLATTTAAPEIAAQVQSREFPDTLELFQAYLKSSEATPFAAPSAPRLGPSGHAGSGLMIFIDMPSAEDFDAGTLLSGEAGRLFDRMLAAIGRDRGSIYLASLSPLRSPGGQFPQAAAAPCAALASHHIALVAPKAVLLMGAACSRILTGEIPARARGRWHEINTKSGKFKALVTMPPSYLLDQPRAKALAWADLQMLVEGLTE